MTLVRRRVSPERIALTPTVRVPARVRDHAFNWIVVGRAGSPALPHVFAVARARWEYDREDMRLAETALAALQTVPGGSVGGYLDTLAAMRARALAKADHGTLTVADLSRSPELRHAVVERIPGTILERVAPGDGDGWDHPFRDVGRLLLLSRLHAWFGVRKIAGALPADDGNPNLWTLPRVRTALEAARAKPPKADEGGPAASQEDSADDDAVLAVAQCCWWATALRPSPFADDPDAQEPRRSS